MRCCRRPDRPGCARFIVLLLAGAWAAWLLKSLVRLCRLACRDRAHRGDRTIPAWAQRQPDPLIYSQGWLMSQGLAVTWDNPDIHVERPGAPGVPVDSHALAPSTDYVVVAQVWNGSAHAPVVDLPVHVSYLEFGIGTVRHDVGQVGVDLPVKGAPGLPAVARVPWRTPDAAGHYCLQVDLVWPDDANPANNLGQHNTDVKALNSPRAVFTFALRNPGRHDGVLRLEADGYAIPPPRPCPPGEERPPVDDHEREGAERHRRERWPVPEGWRAVLEPSEVALGAGQQTRVTVDVTAPDGFHGRQALNVNAYDGDELVGGVTLYAEGRA